MPKAKPYKIYMQWFDGEQFHSYTFALEQNPDSGISVDEVDEVKASVSKWVDRALEDFEAMNIKILKRRWN